MKHLSALFLAVLLLCVSSAGAGTIHPVLLDQLDKADTDEAILVHVFMKEQADIQTLNEQLKQAKAPLSERHESVLLALQDAARSQDGLLVELEAAKAFGGVKDYRSYWITNVIAVEATAEEIHAIAARGDVAVVEPWFQPELIEPTRRGTSDPSQEKGAKDIGITPGLTAINADRVWYELGITGAGVLIGSLDTGVDGTHPALTARWRGNIHPPSECWLDVLGNGSTTPVDYNDHGTHTTGTMCGIAPNDTIGVAWEATWIACNAIDQYVSEELDSDITACFQWLADPDGNPATTDDVPDVVQNSWGAGTWFGYPECDDLWWAVLDNCEAAGSVHLFSAANEGPSSNSMGIPAGRATTLTNAFAVGAVDATAYGWPYPIASFSSRGPSDCTGVPAENLIKPEVVGPGVDVYSSVPGGGYQDGWNGTSMSGPHVAGTAALMRQANPDLDVDTIKEILMETSRDLGVAGEENTYGHGFIDAYAAVLAALEGSAELEGYVYNGSAGGTPIEDATVVLLGETFSRTTDASGYYNGFAAPGSYTARASAPGFADVELPVTLVDGVVTSQNFSLVDNAGPMFLDLDQPIATSDVTGPYTITAEVIDNSGVTGVTLYYRISSWQPWQPVAMTAAGGDLYTADIPGFAAHTRIDFYVEATDGGGLVSTDPVGAPTGFHSLYITERVYVHDAEDPGDPGWTLGVAGDGATTGLWERSDPVQITYNSMIIQPENDVTAAPGVKCYVTGTDESSSGQDDVDDGCTTLLSPTFDLGGALKGFVSYWRWYSESGNSVDDVFSVDLSNDGGSSWNSLEVVDGNQNSWQQVTFELTGLSSQMQLRFLACDLNSGGLVEACIDELAVEVFNDNLAAGPEPTPTLLPSLSQNRPNPFNPSTRITFRLTQAGDATLKVFDLNGRLVRTLVSGHQESGLHQVDWNGRDHAGRAVASGTYFYRLDAGTYSESKRMTLIK